METTHKLKTVSQSRETIELNDSLHEPRADLQVLRLTRQGGSRKLNHFRPLRNLRLVLPIAFRQIIICPARFAYLVVDSGILEVFACWVVAGNWRQQRSDIHNRRRGTSRRRRNGGGGGF